MKPTAVEFAVEQLEQLIPFGHQLAIRIILEQALEREKQQIIDARVNAPLLNTESKYDYVIEAEQYYNKTFKQQTPWYDEDQTTKRMDVVAQNGNDGEHYKNK